MVFPTAAHPNPSLGDNDFNKLDPTLCQDAFMQI
jgi:hypothetical protein